MPKSLEAPANTDSCTYTALGTLDVYDAVLNCDYQFVVYKEAERSGGWRVRIKSSQTTGVVFEPDAMASQARAAGAQGKPFFTWGAGIDPSAGDPRLLQYRVHVANGAPSAIEIACTMRKADHSADAPKSLKVKWPA